MRVSRRGQRTVRSSLSLVPLLALAACHWIASTDDPLPRAVQGSDAGPDAAGDASTDALVVDAGGEAAPRSDSGVPVVDEILADRPSALYRLVGVVNGLCFDTSGNHHDVTLGCGYQYPREPIVVKSADPAIGLASEAPTECTFPLDPVLDFTNGDFAYELWVRAASDGRVLSSRASDGGATGIELTLASTATSVNVSYLRQGATALATATTAILSQPKHLVVTSTNGVPTVWVNGTKTTGMLVKQESLPKASIRVGEAEGEYGPIVVYDHSLSDDRVLAHWRAGSGN